MRRRLYTILALELVTPLTRRRWSIPIGESESPTLNGTTSLPSFSLIPSAFHCCYAHKIDHAIDVGVREGVREGGGIAFCSLGFGPEE